jgi:quercetin dioxygenase-like cupin family protein
MSAKKKVVAVLGAVGFGAAIGVALDRAAVAQQGGGIKRTMLTRIDDPGTPAYEAVMAIAELAPGASSGKHFHHGVEFGYILEGSVELEHEGRPTVTAKAGDTFKNDVVAATHNAKNPGSAPAKILAIYLVEKGKPLAEPR